MPALNPQAQQLAANLDALQAGGVVCTPAGLGLVRVAGDDAASFLHTQLTNAVEDLAPGTARLAGYCSPKGRLLATFLMWRDADGIVLQLSAEIQAPVQKRLSMFVLRAKAKLSDITATHVILGVAGAGAAGALAAAGLPAPETAFAVAAAEGATVIRLPDSAGQPRWQLVLPAGRADAVRAALSATLTAAAPALWDWLEVQSGLPRIVAATQEQFVPQMINFELVGGVNFRKGCYPGQEVVARSQYRGTLKRRMWLVQGEGEVPAPAAEIYRPEDPGQPCGMIVNAAPAPDGGWAALAELKIDAAGSALRLGSAGGAAVATATLPYAVPLGEAAQAAG
ncbi:YgfZ/GcvT domain-containing protein [Cupriavidus neocaledonicus]|uniref:Aminomethyl transferase n=1 Tax=Cupriavidus neocaledonicus TaxID=1040979 RepID=A0A375H3Q2_9BURK|nr:folate-binding protein YgfZ [Cupriavidus neocaledonicus]SOZ34705.1 putative aminomethyl transferase [Cupriavidus neocaledonicus]SPD46531.1 Folate-binding protein [Cupriavidus neocaledonicus]